MASSKIGMANEDEIPDHLACPVCFNLPKGEVFQCRDGHVLCSKCYFKMKKCPQCRDPLDKAHPIRNRYFEQELEKFVKVDCPFKSNGCKEKVRRDLLESHKDGCYFNFKKFGFPVNICEILKKGCNFLSNLSNVEDTVSHFESAHGAKLTTGGEFAIELCNFKDGNEEKAASKVDEESLQFFTPIVSSQQKNECYIITIPFKNRGVFQIVSYFLPYPATLIEDEPLRKPDIDMKFSFVLPTVGKDIKSSFMKLVLVQTPRTLLEALDDDGSSGITQDLLNPYISPLNTLLINCKIRSWNGVRKRIHVMELVECEKTTLKTEVNKLKTWNCSTGSDAAKAYLRKLKEAFGSVGEFRALEMVDRIMESALDKKDSLSTKFGKQDFEYILYGAVFTVAEFGPTEALKRMMQIKDFYWGVVNVVGATLLHRALWDVDYERGLEKAELLVDKIDCKVLDGYKCSLLHHAARKSNGKGVAFACRLGLNVNAKDKDKNTPLHEAMRNITGENATRQKVKILLKHGANPDAKNKEGNTPLDILYLVAKDNRLLKMNMDKLVEAHKK